MSWYPSRIGGHFVDHMPTRPRGTLLVYRCLNCGSPAKSPGEYYDLDCNGGGSL